MSHAMNSDVITTMDVAPSSGLDVHEPKNQDDNSREKDSFNGIESAKEKPNSVNASNGETNGSSCHHSVSNGASIEPSTSVAAAPKMIGSYKKEIPNSVTAPKMNGASQEASSSNPDPPKRTEEEEKLRKRLHAKKEEERLRDIIKRKKESFRNSNNNSNVEGNLGHSNHGNGENRDDSKEEWKEPVETKKDEGPKTNGTLREGAETRGEAPRDLSRRTDPNERRPPHEMGRRDRRHRDRRPDRHTDRRPPPPHRHSGRQPPHFREDRRGRPPPPRGPYDSYYDPRRPPHRGRGDDARPFRRDETVEDIDHFGRSRRSVPDSIAARRYSADDDDHHRGKRSRSRSRSIDSRSSGSDSSSASSSRSSYDSSRRRKRRRSRSSSSDRSHRSNGSYSTKSRSKSLSSSSASAKSVSDKSSEDEPSPYSKDQRTVFVTQLVMRTTIKDIKKFFKEQDIKVNEIELLRDRRSGHHKGSAYVELKRMIDVAKAVNLSGHAPSFQRFPIMIKASEAERNYVQPLAIAPLSTTDSSNVSPTAINAVAALQQQLQLQALKVKLPPLKDESGRLIQAQKVYVGNLEVNSVTSQHLQVLFAPFGTLTEIQLQHGKGFAFLQYYDPKEAALAIQTMAGQILAGRPMKTGWATNQVLSINGVAVVTSNEFPPDAAIRVQNAYQVLAQLTNASAMAQVVPSPLPLGAAPTTPMVASSVPTVADARASLAAVAAANAAKLYPTTVVAPHVSSVSAALTVTGSVPDPMVIGNSEHASPHLLVHNMFNKDEETEMGWEKELRDEFIEECSKYGTIVDVIVVSREVGGKIYASFSDVAGAQTCARSLAGRWFDRKQLRVEFTTEDQVKRIEMEYSASPTVAAS